ncbi:hypothetical protein BJX61DRAFT_530526 [Aspergillus egyptiacus]|nr:hypothetical protein BJX61DRAFT_530526 [Aspergillus egyptiacus]
MRFLCLHGGSTSGEVCIQERIISASYLDISLTTIIRSLRSNPVCPYLSTYPPTNIYPSIHQTSLPFSKN